MIVLLQKKLIKAYLGYTPKRHYLEQAAIGINPKHLYFRRGQTRPHENGDNIETQMLKLSKDSEYLPSQAEVLNLCHSDLFRISKFDIRI